MHTLERIAHCELELRNIEKAKDLFTKAIHLIKELYDEDHPILEKIYFGLAKVHRLEIDYDKSKEYINKAFNKNKNNME